MKAGIFFLIAATALFSSLSPVAATEASNDQILVTVQNKVTLKGTCANIELSYKILPRYRQTPGWIRFNLRPTPGFDEEVSHSYRWINYNIDMNSGTWKFNNVDFFGNVSLNFCKNDGFDGEAKRTGIKKSGLYYVTAYPVFVTNPSSIKGDSSFLTIPIKINVKSSIICLKGNQTKKVSGFNPTCPKGYREATITTAESPAPLPKPTPSPTKTYVIPKDFNGETCFPYKTKSYFGGSDAGVIIRVPETPYDYRAAVRSKGLEFSVSFNSESSPPAECLTDSWFWSERLRLERSVVRPSNAERPNPDWVGTYLDYPASGSETYSVETSTPDICEVSKNAARTAFSNENFAVIIGKQAGYCKLTVRLQPTNWYKASENYVYYVIRN
jgi:hypothetical protein